MLTEKQKRFADEYLIDLNATRAYKTAYPRVKKDETAASAAARMLRNVKVAKYVAKRMQERQQRVEITQDDVLRELAAIAFAELTDYVEIKDGRKKVKNTEELTKQQRKAIESIRESQYGGIEIKLGNKEKALELLGRHLGMWNDKLELTSAMDEEKSKLDDLIEQMRGGDGSS